MTDTHRTVSMAPSVQTHTWQHYRKQAESIRSNRIKRQFPYLHSWNYQVPTESTILTSPREDKDHASRQKYFPFRNDLFWTSGFKEAQDWYNLIGMVQHPRVLVLIMLLLPRISTKTR